MELALGVVGVVVVLLVLVDALWTALWVDGSAGPLTGRTTTWIWNGVQRLAGRGHHAAVSVTGPLVLVFTVAQWIFLLWAGWVLLLGSDDRALLSTSGPGTADLSGRIWFVGYTMFTVGNGDFRPPDGPWQIVSGLIAVTGMSLVTLAITYLLNVVSAVVGKRSFADSVSGLGTTPEEFVLSGWDGRDLRPLDLPLTTLSSQLSEITEQYLSYPVLQYYHARSATKSPAKAVAVLDDALSLMAFGVAPEHRPSPAAIASARSAVRSFLDDTRKAASIEAAQEPPPLPSLAALRGKGIRTCSDEEFALATRELADRRRTTLGVVHGDGWKWED